MLEGPRRSGRFSMAFAYGTKVATPNGFLPIEQFEVGDAVLAASMVDGRPYWAPRQVAYSEGAGPPQQSAMVYVIFGSREALIATPDQLFLLQDAILKGAESLLPTDLLAGADGVPVPIHNIAIGSY